MLICNNHPAGMCVLGEVTKDEGLDLIGRGVPKSELGNEVVKFLSDCQSQNKACAGIIKSFNYQVVKYVLANDGIIIQKVRNPIHIVAWRFKKKPEAAIFTFRELYGRNPETLTERFEGHCKYYASRFYDKFLRHAEQYPIIRIEDLNESMRTDGLFFRRAMENVTGTVWADDYTRHIQNNWTPDQIYRFYPRWNDGRITRVDHTILDRRRGKCSGWDEDLRNALYWEQWTQAQRDIYYKHFASIQNQLGYNQSYPGSTDAKWKYSDAYDWSTP